MHVRPVPWPVSVISSARIAVRCASTFCPPDWEPGPHARRVPRDEVDHALVLSLDSRDLSRIDVRHHRPKMFLKAVEGSASP